MLTLAVLHCGVACQGVNDTCHAQGCGRRDARFYTIACLKTGDGCVQSMNHSEGYVNWK